MQDVLWWIFGWICKVFGFMMLISVILLFVSFIWHIVTNGGRKWYYYNPSKPWKGGYWAPLLPTYPPYNDYRWNPETCRFEHKKRGEPLYSWEKPLKQPVKKTRLSEWDWDELGLPEEKPIVLQKQKQKQCPEWIRFLFEENIGTLMEKRRRKKSSRNKQTQ